MPPSYARRRNASLLRTPTDLRGLFGSPVRQQGPRPLCVPFSIASAHEAVRVGIGAPGAEELAVEPLWRYCVQDGQASHAGTTLDAGSAAVRAKGQTTERHWPYNLTLGAATESEPASATAAPWYVAATSEVPLAHDGIEALIEDALTAKLPVVLVIEITPQFEAPAADGEIMLPPLTSAIGDYHAVLVTGASTDPSAKIRRLLIRNSWGAGWGAGGYGWLPLDYLIAFAVQAATIDPTSLAQCDPSTRKAAQQGIITLQKSPGPGPDPAPAPE